MRVLAIILLAVGVVVIGLGLSVDRSVSTGFGRLDETGLMNDKQNLLIGGAVLLFAGLVIATLTRRGPR